MVFIGKSNEEKPRFRRKKVGENPIAKFIADLKREET
jgi:hypothetical protein